MICFLTSNPFLPDGGIDPANGFFDCLLAAVRQPARLLFVCSSPDDPARTDHYAAAIRGSLERAGVSPASFAVLDRRTADHAAALVADADLLILAGGHVPTQNRFFAQIGLRELLRGWDGVLVGISAGSMNSAETVYAQPEEPGEAIDPGYRRFLPGLGLTKTMLLPHYQAIRGDVLDGLRVIEDITCPDSMGRTFYAIVDGSYLLIRGGAEELRGEAYRIRDGQIHQICVVGESVHLK